MVWVGVRAGARGRAAPCGLGLGFGLGQLGLEARGGAGLAARRLALDPIDLVVGPPPAAAAARRPEPTEPGRSR